MGLLTDMVRALGNELLILLFATSSRSYLPFLVTGLIIAWAAQKVRREQDLAPAERLFSKVSWTSRSATNDYALVLLNAVIMTVLISAIVPKTHYILDAVKPMLSAPVFDATGLGASLLLAATIFIVDDFCRYISHYLEHRIPFLWELHKVHHSAEALNFVTAERHHPLSLFFYQCVFVGGAALGNLLFLWLFPHQLTMTTWLGGNIFWIVSNLAGGVLRHSPMWISFGPRIERWFISPAQHQIHHSADAKHFDRNFGSTLAIWDRWFGSLYTTTSQREHLTYGLGDETRNYRSLTDLYIVPLVRVLQRFFPHRSVATS